MKRFRWYRRLVGGDWYLVSMPGVSCAMAQIPYWVHRTPHANEYKWRVEKY